MIPRPFNIHVLFFFLSRRHGNELKDIKYIYIDALHYQTNGEQTIMDELVY